MSLRIENREGRYILTDGFAQRDPTGAELEFWMRLATLVEEVLRLMVLGGFAGHQVLRMRDTPVSPDDYPFITALLREAADRV